VLVSHPDLRFFNSFKTNRGSFCPLFTQGHSTFDSLPTHFRLTSDFKWKTVKSNNNEIKTLTISTESKYTIQAQGSSTESLKPPTTSLAQPQQPSHQYTTQP
jgi:hypothetical protein